MNREQRLELLDDARSELLQAREQLAALNRRVQQLTQVVNGLSGLLNVDEDAAEAESNSESDETDYVRSSWSHQFLTRSPRANNKIVRPRDAVMQVLSLRPNTPLAPKDVVDLVRRAGLFNPNLKSGSNGYTTALNRLAEEPGTGVLREPEGMYVFRPERRAVGAMLTGEGTLFVGGSTSE
ncbi:hypothetical protein ACFRFH_02495 [Leifsonia sp. NPDC056824]|uniref:hypothetical protein n=1 Tax=Leifsonia sp. NPDC056824 TaxID=3345953 RepID=UPI0036A7720E